MVSWIVFFAVPANAGTGNVAFLTTVVDGLAAAGAAWFSAGAIYHFDPETDDDPDSADPCRE